MKFHCHPSFVSYTGNWQNGTFQGWGFLTLKNEESYKGNWISGERSGLGMFIFSKTSPFTQYRGEWKTDEFAGIGKLT